jgi:hypothetical protein
MPHWSASAGRWARRRSPAPSPTRSTRAAGPGFPDRGVQRAGRGRRVHVGAAQRLAGWRGLAHRADLCQCLRGLCGVSRHGCTPGLSSWEELQFFLKRGVKRPDLRNDAAGTDPLGHHPPRRLAGHARLCLRPPAVRGDGGRGGHARRPHSILQEAVPEAALQVPGSIRLWNPVRLPAGARCAFQAVDTGLWIGRPTEGRGRAPSRWRASAPISAGFRNGRWSMWSSAWCSPIPTTMTATCGRANRDGSEPVHRRAPQPAGIPAGGDPL